MHRQTDGRRRVLDFNNNYYNDNHTPIIGGREIIGVLA